MSETTYNLSLPTPGRPALMQASINNSGLFLSNCLGVRKKGNNVYVVFENALLPAEEILLDTWASEYTEASANYSPSSVKYIAHARSIGWTTTNYTDWRNKLSLDVVNMLSGTYKISWSYSWSFDSTSHDFIARVLFNDTEELHFHQEEPKEAGGSGYGGTDQKLPTSGWDILVLTEDMTCNFKVQWKSSLFNKDASIGNARLLVERLV